MRNIIGKIKEFAKKCLDTLSKYLPHLIIFFGIAFCVALAWLTFKKVQISKMSVDEFGKHYELSPILIKVIIFWSSRNIELAKSIIDAYLLGFSTLITIIFPIYAVHENNLRRKQGYRTEYFGIFSDDEDLRVMSKYMIRAEQVTIFSGDFSFLGKCEVLDMVLMDLCKDNKVTFISSKSKDEVEKKLQENKEQLKNKPQESYPEFYLTLLKDQNKHFKFSKTKSSDNKTTLKASIIRHGNSVTVLVRDDESKMTHVYKNKQENEYIVRAVANLGESLLNGDKKRT